MVFDGLCFNKNDLSSTEVASPHTVKQSDGFDSEKTHRHAQVGAGSDLLLCHCLVFMSH